MNQNPYSAPSSSVISPSPKSTSFEFHNPRRVPASRGANWVTEGFDLFKTDTSSVIHWILVCVLYLILIFIVIRIAALFPIVNSFSSAVSFLWIGGLVLGSHHLDTEKKFTAAYFFQGLMHKPGALLAIGVIYTLLSTLVGLACFGSNYLLMIQVTGTEEELLEYYSSLMVNPIEDFLLPGLIMLLFAIPLLAAVWFAPALIILHNLSIVKAMGLSFKACLINFFPLLVNGLLFLVLIILSPLTLFLGLFVIFPMMFTSLYCSYKDVFVSIN